MVELFPGKAIELNGCPARALRSNAACPMIPKLLLHRANCRLTSLRLNAGLALLSVTLAAHADTKDVQWREYLGGPDRSHYSLADEITPKNVGQLQVAWEYHSGEYGQVQANSLMIEGILYGVTSTGSPFALDAKTGRELWRFRDPADQGVGRVIRGLSYWTDGNQKRIFFSRDSFLCALDASTGQLIESFGEHGKTSLRAGLGETANGRFVVSTTPGTVYHDIIVMPTRVEESEDAALGWVQAFDVRSGKLVWVFHTIPLPGEAGYETWPKDAYTNFNVGSANNWPGMALDRKRGIIYVPIGSASPDFWGGNRLGQDLYANCLLALDAATGKHLWHYQFVHHDIWDRDPPAPPNLITVHREGKAIDAVAQVTKQGLVFVFDRVTGAPLFPIDEVAMPASTMDGEKAWPTQPIPRAPAPYARQDVSESDLNPYSKNHDDLVAMYRQSQHGRFVPLSTKPTIVFPGFDGGAEWGGAAADPEGILYVNETEMAWVAQLIAEPKADALAAMTPGHRLYATTCVGCHGPDRKGNPSSGFPSLINVSARKSREDISKLLKTGRGMMPSFPWLNAIDQEKLIDFLYGTEKTEGSGGEATPAVEIDRKTPYKLDGYVKFLDVEGYPAIKPPWGTLNAIDLNTGKYLWKVVLGDDKEIHARSGAQTGSENYGGPVVTKSGVLFIAATKDGMFRAFDKHTGALLWETKLPAAGFATPTTYQIGGKQFVVVACGGTKLDTPKGDSYVAFALP